MLYMKYQLKMVSNLIKEKFLLREKIFFQFVINVLSNVWVSEFIWLMVVLSKEELQG